MRSATTLTECSIATIIGLRKALEAEDCMCRLCTINVRWPFAHPGMAGCGEYLHEPTAAEMLGMTPQQLEELLPEIADDLSAFEDALENLEHADLCDYCMHHDFV